MNWRALAVLVALIGADGTRAFGQSLGTIEPAVVVRGTSSDSAMNLNSAVTTGVQLTAYLARPLAVEVDVSQGRVGLLTTTAGITFRPISARAVYMLFPWGDTRLLTGLGYTHYWFSEPPTVSAPRNAFTVSAGVQHDKSRVRGRVDFDALVLKRHSTGESSYQVKGAVRLSLALRSHHVCCP